MFYELVEKHKAVPESSSSYQTTMKHLVEENRRKDLQITDLQQQVEQWRTKSNDLYIEVEILNKTVTQLKVVKFICISLI